MSRNRSSKNDWRRYRKFEQENEKLRKEVNKLRKVINNIVIDELEKRALRVDDGEPAHLPICEICGNEDLYAVPIKRPDGEFEIRICKSCGHRHSMKKVKTK
jgi:hypothetical protein